MGSTDKIATTTAMKALLTLIASTALVSHSTTTAACSDQSVSTCNINNSSEVLWTSNIIPDAETCQTVCNALPDCLVFRFTAPGLCQLLKTDYRQHCRLVGSSSLQAGNQTTDDCLNSYNLNSCEGFVDEDCEYTGTALGLDPPAGEIRAAEECESLCRLFEGLNCTYWVFNLDAETCHLLGSGQRQCKTLSGPEQPSIQACREATTSSTTQPTTFSTSSTTFSSSTPHSTKFSSSTHRPWPTTTVLIPNTTVLDCDRQAVFSGEAVHFLEPVDNHPPEWSPANITGYANGVQVNAHSGNLEASMAVMTADSNASLESTGLFWGLEDGGMFGLVVGGTSRNSFYLIAGPGRSANRTHFSSWSIFYVDSESNLDVSSDLVNAIWRGESVPGQIKLLYTWPGSKRIIRGTFYSWHLHFQPDRSSLRFSLLREVGLNKYQDFLNEVEVALVDQGKGGGQMQWGVMAQGQTTVFNEIYYCV